MVGNALIVTDQPTSPIRGVNQMSSKIGKHCGGLEHDFEKYKKCSECRIQAPTAHQRCGQVCLGDKDFAEFMLDAYEEEVTPKKRKRKKRDEAQKKDPIAEADERIKTCKGPLEEDCVFCPVVSQCIRTDIYWYSRLPHWLVDKYLSKLPSAATKVFIFLNRTANFNKDSNHFGRCWHTYEQIAQATGLGKSTTTIGRHIEPLIKLGLIEHKQTKTKEGKWKTQNQFTVTWLKRMKEIKKNLDILNGA
jgi:hypothetical protein